MTYLQLVNKVLRGLREDQVESFDADYPALVAQLVNEAKDDIEAVGPWYALRTTINKTLADGENSADLTAETNEKSYLLYDQNRPMAFSVTADQEWRLQVVTYSEILALRALNPDQQSAPPYAVAFNRSGSGLTAHFWPASSGSNNVRFVMVVPQADLEDETDELTIPGDPVWREALVRAMEERGEEFAGPIDAARQRALQSRIDATMRDFGADPLTVEAV